MLLRNPIHFGARPRFLGRQTKQIPYLIQSEPKIPAPANETKPSPMRRSIRPVISVGSGDDWH
jgi:hypothetical protein